MRVLIATALVLTLLQIGRTAAHDPEARWGRVVHEITGHVAQTFLSTAAAREVLALLPSEQGQLARVAYWADEVRPGRPYTGPMHYINTPDWACRYVYPTDCSDGVCVDMAIQNYTARMVNRALPLTQRAEALKYLVHFIGDVHQPMHVGFASDQGGNRISLRFFNANTNLHALWDTPMIARRISQNFGNDAARYVAHLESRLRGDWARSLPGWRSCRTSQPHNACSRDWARESAELACSNAYVNTDGRTRLVSGVELGEAYYVRNWPVSERRVVMSGVRLANVLNSVFGPADNKHNATAFA